MSSGFTSVQTDTTLLPVPPTPPPAKQQQETDDEALHTFKNWTLAAYIQSSQKQMQKVGLWKALYANTAVWRLASC